MVLFFFYNQDTYVELIKKMNTSYEMNDGYIIVQSYDAENNVVKISDKIENNNTKLYGKIFNFNMNLNDILKKITEIKKSQNKFYRLDIIDVKKEIRVCL